VGGIAAGLCGLHCAVMPAIPLLVGLNMPFAWMEDAILLVSLAVGATAISQGWRRHHNVVPGILWLSGSAMALSGHLGEALVNDAVLRSVLLIGAMLQVFSHWSNHRSVSSHCA